MAWPIDVLDILVEIYVSGGWVDITTYVRRNEGAGINITDGTTGQEQRRAGPSQARFQLNNRDGRFSPRNPASPYYRLIGLNTEIRISAEGVYHFWGEVGSGWPTEWTSGAPSTGDAWVPIVAYGRSARINADTGALPDPLYTAVADADPYFYWAMTDPAGAQVAEARQAAGFDYIPALQAYSNRPPTFAGTSGPPGSSSTPDFTNQGGLTAQLTSYISGSFQVICWFKLDSGDSTDFGLMVPWQIDLNQPTTQSPTAIDIIMYAGLSSFFTPGIDRVTFNLAMYENYPPTNAGRSTNLNLVVTGAYAKQDVWHELRVVFEQTSASVITASLYLNGALLGSDATTTGTWTMGSPTRVVVNPSTTTGAYASSATGIGLASLAHFVIDSSTTDLGTYAAGYGYAGEHAGRRIERIADQLDVAFVSDGDLDLTATMGPQSVGTSASAIFEEAATADGGLLADDREALGLRYVTRQELYNQTAALALDYTATAEVMPSLSSDESASRVANSVTASSAAGSVTVEQDTGLRSVAEPSAVSPGVGRYPATISPNVDSLTQLGDAAAWAVRIGAADVPRFTSIKVNLFAMAKAGKAALAAAAAAVTIGRVVTIANTPIWIPDDVACFATGRTVRLANY
jgi:hypothetical protein